MRAARAGSGRGEWQVRAARAGSGRGEWRIEDLSLVGWLTWRGTGGASPDFSAAPWAVSAALPDVLGTLAPSDTYVLVCRRRNAWGLVSQNAGPEVRFEIDADGEAVGARPSGPYAVATSASSGGCIRVQAWYNALVDGAAAATRWLVYQTDDGSDPDPAVDVPTVVTMAFAGPVARLDWTSGAFAGGATVKTLVRTRRVSGVTNLDSANVAPSSATASTATPSVPAGEVFLGSVWKQGQD